MGLKGTFEWYKSLRTGGRKAISFTLKCDNILQSETFDCAIMRGDGSIQPMVFRQLKLKANQAVQFNYDTIDWQWCNGDTFAILGKKDKIKQRWDLSISTYAPGECPECHGTHKCRICSGRGFVYLPNRSIEQCSACFSTGICQECYVPQRNEQTFHSPTHIENIQSSNNRKIDVQVENLRRAISDLQQKIEKTQWDMRMMQLKDMDQRNSSVYLSYDHLLHQYNIQMFELQNRLAQLENLRQ